MDYVESCVCGSDMQHKQQRYNRPRPSLAKMPAFTAVYKYMIIELASPNTVP